MVATFRRVVVEFRGPWDPWDPWGPWGPRGPKWGPYGPIWANMGPSGAHVGPIWPKQGSRALETGWYGYGGWLGIPVPWDQVSEYM